jgi:hypothetical protein
MNQATVDVFLVVSLGLSIIAALFGAYRYLIKNASADSLAKASQAAALGDNTAATDKLTRTIERYMERTDDRLREIDKDIAVHESKLDELMRPGRPPSNNGRGRLDDRNA